MKRVIVSGFFNPLHGGHLDLFEEAKALGDQLIVIINNDQQQHLKKGKIILDEMNRMRLVAALRVVDEAVLSIDSDPPVGKTLREIALKYPNDRLIFANGGDRSGHKKVPGVESVVCKEMNIKMAFGIGSGDVEKRDSSTRINHATGHEAPQNT